MAKLAFAGFVAATALAIVAAPSAQDVASFNKPLERFTIGDLFPKLSGGLMETANAWKSSGDNARSLASARSRDLKAAMEPVKVQVEQAKDEAKTADKNKDFAAAGAAQGKVKTGEIVLELLDRLQNVASRQEDTAEAWSRAADAMRKFAEVDNDFDKYRGAGIAKPAAGQKDSRLDSAGYNAFKGHADALKSLGTSLSQLGDKLNGLGADRLKFAGELEKGGHIQSK
jgi:hypothetical protein